MSLRLPASSLGLALLLTIGSTLVLAIAEPVAAFGERPFESNEVINPANLDVFSGQSVAQSFLATDAYVLLSVTLRLLNTGGTSDSINISVRSDAGLQPSSLPLAWTETFAGPSITLLNVSLPQSPVLARGTRYWIVATHSGQLSDSYRWYHSNSNTFADGRAMQNLNLGGGWINVTPQTDMYFRTFGREHEANLSLGQIASRSEASPRDLVIFTVFYNNSGTLTARKAWLNLTLPPGLTYLGDTASGSTTSYPRLTFDDVINGPHAFTVSSRVEIGVVPGTFLIASSHLDFVDSMWASGPPASAQSTILVGLATKRLHLAPGRPGPPHLLTPLIPTGGLAEQANLTLRKGNTFTEFDLSPGLARSFRVWDMQAALYLDSDSGRTQDLDVNVTLQDWDGVVPPVSLAYHQSSVTTNGIRDFEPFVFDFAPLDRTIPQPHTIRLRIRIMGSSSDDALLGMNSTFAPSRIELRTSTYVRIDTLELRDAQGPASGWTALDSLVMRLNVSDPFGTDEIGDVRLNATDPSGTQVLVLESPTKILTDPSPRPAWNLYESILSPPLANGSYRIEGIALERDGATHLATRTAVAASPGFTLTKDSTVQNARNGERFFYQISINNTGTGEAARVWLNETFPSEVNVLSNSDPVNQTGPSSWYWSSVVPGTRRMDIEVEVRTGIPQVPFFRNLATLTFVDTKGHVWPAVTAVQDVVLNGPLVTLTMTSDRATLHATETVEFTIQLANTGDAARTLWLNDTLPTGLDYVSNDADTLGGITSFSGGAVRILLQNLPATTTWTVRLVARATTGLPAGEVLTNRADLNYTNTDIVLMPPQETSGSVGILAPRLMAPAATLGRTTVTSGDVVPTTIDLWNDGNEPALAAWLNLTLGPFLDFKDASRPATFDGRDVRFLLPNLAVGAGRIFLNLTVNVLVPDLQEIQIAGSLDFADGVGNLMTGGTFLSNSARASEPVLVLSVSPANATIEAGGTINVTILHTNAGSGTAGDIWLNFSLPATLVYRTDDADTSLIRSGYANYEWHWGDRDPGSRSFTVEFEAKTFVRDLDFTNLTFRIEYFDSNGNRRASTSATSRIDFVSPEFELDLTAQTSEISSGGTLSYQLRVKNVGSMTARRVWVLDAVSSRFEIVSHDARVRAEGAPNLNWTFEDVFPDQEEVITLVVRLLDGAGAGTPIANVVEVEYTNSVGVVVGYRRTIPVTVVVSSLRFPLEYLYAGGSALAAVGLAVIVRRRNPNIEEVFLVYRDGILIYHLSRSIVQDRDEDVLSGMLTAVQEFVRDAFRYGEHRQLQFLDFGDYRILIERGRMVYLAVVYSGRDTSGLRRKIRSVLSRIEVTFASVLENWNGDMDHVVGAREMIRDQFFRPTGRRPTAPYAK